MNFYDIIRFIIVFQFLFLAFFLFTSKRGNRLSNSIFGVFLLSKAICFSNSLIFRYSYTVVNWSPHLFYIGDSFEFLLGPALYFYTKSLAYKSFSCKKRDLLHLIPFAIHLVFMMSRYHLYSAETKLQLLDTYLFSYTEYVIIYLAIYIHFIIYSALSLYVISKYRDELKRYFSQIHKIKLSWLNLVLMIFIFLWGTSMITFIFRNLGWYIPYPRGLSTFLLFIFSNVIMYKGLKQPEIFSGVQNGTNGEKPMIKEEDVNAYLTRLEACMQKEKPYLNPDITLNDLAEHISIPGRYLSYVINKSYKQNFYDYINSFRIEESKKMLQSTHHENKTILEILYSAGFNSKSVFNSAFKKQVGLTPSEYKRQSVN